MPTCNGSAKPPKPDIALDIPQGRLIEIFFSVITRQAIRRGSFTSVADLIAAIEAFIDGWNDRCHPFTWTKTADEILLKCRPGKRTSFTRH